VDRRLALVAVWALFAAAAVGVGFGAAGLVGDPFTDGEVSTGGITSSAVPSTSSEAPTTSTSALTTTAGPRPVKRSVTVRGGLVTGTCRSGLVSLGAAPSVGWEIDDLDDEAGREARVKFERVDDGDGEVEVRARCVGGVPTFTVDDDSSGSGSGDSGSGESGSGDSGPGGDD
jgi:hypothetical protein